MICTVKDCERVTRTASSPYCEKHYSRWKRHGDPMVVLKDHTPARQRWKTNYAIDERTGCWNWLGPFSRAYGFVQDGAHKRYQAHRFVYEQVIGPIPADLELDHKCRNTHCVNPKHLEPTTHRINVQRGDAGIRNAEKTVCDHGHEFTPENTIIRKDTGYRQCRACLRRTTREAMRRRRAKGRD